MTFPSPVLVRVRAYLAPVMAALLVACSDGSVNFPLTAEGQKDLGDAVELVVLDAGNIEAFSRPARGHSATSLPSGLGWAYHVGVGDVLAVIVFDHPELTLPAGPTSSATDNGFVVSSLGTFNYPYIGEVEAVGRTVEDIRADVAARLAEFVPDPQVDVRVAAYNAQAVLVSGEVNTPNRQPLTAVPVTLVAAVNAAGGFTEAADQRRVTVQRAGRVYEVDLQGFLNGTMPQNNPLLRNEDVIAVPRRLAEEAYILGEVAEPDAIDLSIERITLTQAIARSGGLQGIRADARGVLVFRGHGAVTRVFQLDTSNPTGLLLGTRFIIEPGDVIYVVRSPLQRWNDTIARLLPTAQAVRVGQTVVE